MKKRRIAIVAFMLATVLTLGVGYAAVSGALNIRGTGTFRGKNLAQNEILDAVKFTEATGDQYCDARIDPADDTVAVLDVQFNDTTGANDMTYQAVATYTIAYTTDSNTEIFPKVAIDAAILTQPQDTNWTVATDWVAKELELGQTATITVTISYHCADSDAVANAAPTGNFAVKLNFATVE